MTLKQFHEVLDGMRAININIKPTDQNVNIYMDMLKAQYPSECREIIGSGIAYPCGEMLIFYSQRKNNEENNQAFIVGLMPALVVTTFNKQAENEHQPQIKIKKTIDDPMRKQAADIKQEVLYQTNDVEKLINLIAEYLTYLRYSPPSTVTSNQTSPDDFDALFSIINQINDFNAAFQQYWQWRSNKGADIFNTYMTSISSSVSKEKSGNTL